MLIASPRNENSSEARRQKTTVSQTPDIQVPSPNGNRPVSASPPELPEITANSTPRAPEASVPSAHAKSSQVPSQASALLPPMTAPQDNAGLNSSRVSNAGGTTRTAGLVSPSQPFQVQSSNNGKMLKIALLVTLIVGGAGSAMVWFQKQRGQKEQTVGVERSRLLPRSEQSSLAAPEKGRKDVENIIKKPTAKPESTSVHQEEPKQKAATDTGPTAKVVESTKTAVKNEIGKAVPKPPVTAPTAKPKKSYKRKWVRKKAKSVLSRLNRAAIEGVMRKEKSAFARCGKATGTKLTVSMEILGSGTVRKVQLFDRGRLAQATKKCLISTFKRTVFPRRRRL